MSEVKQTRKYGLAWHMYHDRLLSWCDDYGYRVAQIKDFKPANELKVRLRRFQLVKGRLPEAFDGVRNNLYLSDLLPDHKQAITALHARECKHCPWNGKRLVFPKYRLRRAWRWLGWKLKRAWVWLRDLAWRE